MNSSLHYIYNIVWSACALLTLCSLSACITDDVEPDTQTGNFLACWKALDENYCFFGEKGEEYGLDWNEVKTRYMARISEGMTDEQLFEVLASMVCELRDGHVNLYANHDVARYGAWFDDYPANYSDTLQRIYLGRSEDYRQTASLVYKILLDNLAYVRCSTFGSQFGDGNLGELMRQVATCDGMILDVRSNGGGQLAAAQKLASLFINEKQTLYYISHKTGRAHDALSAPRAVEVAPFEGLRWQKPVCVLTNRRTYSAANTFAMMLKGLPQVTLVGDRTGGGAGMPFATELPNSWTLRFSACPMYDRQMQCGEEGVEPDVAVSLTDEDAARGKDTIIETARALLKAKH